MRRFFALLAALLAAATPAWTGEAWSGEAGEHDRARAAISAGTAKPLSDLLPAVSARFPGDLLDASLESGAAGNIYRLKILGPDDRVREFSLDALTGAPLAGAPLAGAPPD